MRWASARPVGLGASCAMCGERRRLYLKSAELLGGWVPMCHNCSARVDALQPLPRSLAAIRDALLRNRRDRSRRAGAADSRVYPHNRRRTERRLGRDDGPHIDDDMIVDVADLGTPEAGELTRILDLEHSA